MTRFAALLHSGNTTHPRALKEIQAAAQPHGIQVVPYYATDPEEIERAFEAMTRDKIKAAIVVTDSYFLTQRRQIAQTAIKRRVATIYSNRDSVLAGILMSYGSNSADNYRRAATYVDKILKGTKPADLPIEQPSVFHLAVNLKTAKVLGLRVPQEILGRADEVIE